MIFVTYLKFVFVSRSETKRLRSLGKVYKNPYDFSPWHNWCLFLDMIDGRGWKSGRWMMHHTILLCTVLLIYDAHEMKEK